VVVVPVTLQPLVVWEQTVVKQVIDVIVVTTAFVVGLQDTAQLLTVLVCVQLLELPVAEVWSVEVWSAEVWSAEVWVLGGLDWVGLGLS
jgi:hypothetical protein